MVRFFFLAVKNLLFFQRANRQPAFSQKNPCLRSVTAPPQRGHLPTVSRSEGKSIWEPSITLYVPIRSRSILQIPSMNSLGLTSPRSTSLSWCSHSAVRSGDWSCSGRTVIRETPICVGMRLVAFFCFLRSTKPVDTSFSKIPARVAGVPMPLRSAFSGISFAPAVSIAESSVSSV